MHPKTFCVKAAAILLVLCLQNPSKASDFNGLYPGMNEAELQTYLIDQGDGFYRGVVDGCFTKSICFGGQAGVIDVIYDDSGAEAPPPQLRKFLTLKEAVDLHSNRPGRARPDFGFALDNSNVIYGVVDTNNYISYKVLGPITPSSQCALVSYLRSSAPVVSSARMRKVMEAFQEALRVRQEEVKIFNEDGTPYSEERAQKKENSVKVPNQLIAKTMPTKMADCFKVKLVSKKLEKFGATERLVLLLRLTNTTPKDIRGIKGSVTFVDMFGDEIQKVELKVDSVLPAASSTTEEYGLEFNKYKENHRNLLTCDVNNVSTMWRPEVIIFTDGTTVRKAVVGRPGPVAHGP